MPRVGIADLGSNSARLVVFDYEPGRWYRLVDGIREQIRLGEGLGRGTRLSAPAMDRAVAALDLFADYAAATGLDRIEVIGTSALRDAENRDEFLGRIEFLELDVRLVTGEEEAALGVLAVANGFDLPDGWVVDLGGGSAQVSRMRDRQFVDGKAFPLGAVRLTERYFSSDPPKPSEVEKLEKKIAEDLGATAKKIRRESMPLIAVGGTIRNLARIAQRSTGYPLRLLHGYSLTRKDLEAVTEMLLDAKTKQRARIAGLNPDRADIITAGAVVFRWLMRKSGHERMLISGHGVREGAFYRLFLEAPHLLSRVRAFSVENLLAQHPQPRRHIEQVRRLSARLFEELESVHRLDPGDAEILDAAAALHDVGTTVDYYRHHKHGEYLLTAGALNGFTHREQVLIALLVRYHRKGSPRVGPFKGLVTDRDEARLSALSACLRLAESLERSRAGRILDLEADIGKKVVRLTLKASEEPAVEMWETSQHASLFREAFGRDLELVAEILGGQSS